MCTESRWHSEEQRIEMECWTGCRASSYRQCQTNRIQLGDRIMFIYFSILFSVSCRVALTLIRICVSVVHIFRYVLWATNMWCRCNDDKTKVAKPQLEHHRRGARVNKKKRKRKSNYLTRHDVLQDYANEWSVRHTRTTTRLLFFFLFASFSHMNKLIIATWACGTKSTSRTNFSSHFHSLSQPYFLLMCAHISFDEK